MGQSAEELRHEIAETRGDLGTTVDAITDQVSPARVIAHQKERLAGRWMSIKESVMGSLELPDLHAVAADASDAVTQVPHQAVVRTKGQPVTAGAIAFGLGFLAAAVFPGTRTEGEVARWVQETGTPVADELKQAGHEAAAALREPATEAAVQLKQSATSGAAHVRETAQEASQHTVDAVADAGDLARQQAQSAAARAAD